MKWIGLGSLALSSFAACALDTDAGDPGTERVGTTRQAVSFSRFS